jgi:hypothetical protein
MSLKSSMLLRKLTLFATVWLFAAPTVAQSWIEYLDRVDLFGINFPAAPEVEEIDYLSSFDVIFPARVHRVESGRSTYVMTVVDYTDAQRRHAERPDRTGATNGEWIKDLRGSVAHAAWNIRKRGGEVTYDAWSDIERVEGHQLQITNPDQSRLFVGIYLHNSRLHIIEATVPGGWPPPMHFQQSLRFFDEDGTRVRYELDANGNTTRTQSSYEFGDSGAVVVERVAE